VHESAPFRGVNGDRFAMASVDDSAIGASRDGGLPFLDTTRFPLAEYCQWDTTCAVAACARAQSLTHAPAVHSGDNPPPTMKSAYGCTALLLNRRQFREAFTEMSVLVVKRSDGGSETLATSGSKAATAQTVTVGATSKVQFLSLPLSMFSMLRPRPELEGADVCSLNSGKWVDAAEVMLMFVLYSKGGRATRAALCYDTFFKPHLPVGEAQWNQKALTKRLVSEPWPCDGACSTHRSSDSSGSSSAMRAPR